MSVFTSLFFARGHPIYSRSLLGFSAVVSVLLSIMSGFGLMFCCGVPFTSMSQLLPFVMFGIGLDDAFIIMYVCRRKKVSSFWCLNESDPLTFSVIVMQGVLFTD
mmetsp:Transcript_2100/g.5182  ORF Transcript_2100/g.5182 Transcript_2100/m.5182 type:complete len:105 (+) Transcript_2100:1283-1597(+)